MYRFVANLILGVIVSSPSWADTIRLRCSETLYDKTQNKPYDIPQVFILQDFSTLRWDNKKVDLSVETIERLLTDRIWLGSPITERRMSAFLSWLNRTPSYVLSYGNLADGMQLIADVVG
jgi:hypothetical protein